MTIVGIVPDIHFREYREATPTVLRPYRQNLAQGYFLVRARGSSASAFETMRRAVHDADLVFVSDRQINDFIAPELTSARFDAMLLSLFGVGDSSR